MIVVDFTARFMSAKELLQYFHNENKSFLYCGDKYKPRDTPYNTASNITLVDIDANVEYRYNGHFYEEWKRS